MKRFISCVGLGLLSLPLLAMGQSQLDVRDAERMQAGLVETADRFILPAYVGYAEATQTLSVALETYCDADHDSPISLSPDLAYAEAFLAWQRASLIQVGPVSEAEGPLRFQLWPDPKGFSRRAVLRALAEADLALLEPGALEGYPVALVNLMALEDLIFSEDLETGYGCALAHAIAAYQAEAADILVQVWSPGSAFRVEYDTAVGGNATYGDVESLLRELLAGSVVYVDRLRRFKIERGLGSARGGARAERTEAGQSGLGLASLTVGFEALADFYTVSGGLFEVSEAMGATVEARLLARTARRIVEALAPVQASLTEIANEDGDAAEQIRTYGQQVLFHEAFLRAGFLQSLGLTSGFTSADGD